MAESTRQPGEKFLPSVREHDGGEPGRVGGTTTPTLRQGEAVGETHGGYEGRESEWALPRPTDPRSPQRQRQGRGGNHKRHPETR